MYGNLVSSSTPEIVIELSVIGDEAIVTARQSSDRSNNARIIVTIRKSKGYGDNFEILLGQDTKLINSVVEEKKE